VVAFATDVADDLETVGQTHLGNLTQCRVRLLRGRGVNAGADAATLRALDQRRRGALIGLRAARLADELIDSRHDGTFNETKASRNQPAEKRNYNRKQQVPSIINGTRSSTIHP